MVTELQTRNELKIWIGGGGGGGGGHNKKMKKNREVILACDTSK